MKQSPRVTIIVSPRERYSLSLEALERLGVNTSQDFDLIYADVASPRVLAKALEARVLEHGGRYIRHDAWLPPPIVRRAAMQHVRTDYVVFMDNDVLVHEGWLTALFDCADATDAAIVGPLYLEGNGIEPPCIHMAGGNVTILEDGEGRSVIDRHTKAKQDPVELEGVEPFVCDFMEYHCFLAKSAFMARETAFDDEIETVHEHLDLAFSAKSSGEKIYCAPGAKVTYLVAAEFTVADLDLFARRWEAAAAERSMQRFAEKWGVTAKARSFDPVRSYLVYQRAGVEPLDSSLIRSPENAPAAQRLAQSRTELLEQAVERGYSERDVAELAHACLLAAYVSDGLYRPCGRPFLDHLFGTAGALLLDGCSLPLVMAGLLHGAYSHTVGKLGDEQVCKLLGGRGSPTELLVRAFTTREPVGKWLPWDDDVCEMGLTAVKIALIEAANAVDMRLSGEIAVSRRPDPLDAATQRRVVTLCRTIGAHALAQLLTASSDGRPSSAPAFGPFGSFRFNPEFGRVHLVSTQRPSIDRPMSLSDVRAALRREPSRPGSSRPIAPETAAVQNMAEAFSAAE